MEGIEIIKPGIIPVFNTAVQFECSYCGCIFKAQKGYYEREHDYRDGDFYKADCPTCGRQVIMDCRNYDRRMKSLSKEQMQYKGFCESKK